MLLLVNAPIFVIHPNCWCCTPTAAIMPACRANSMLPSPPSYPIASRSSAFLPTAAAAPKHCLSPGPAATRYSNTPLGTASAQAASLGSGPKPPACSNSNRPSRRMPLFRSLKFSKPMTPTTFSCTRCSTTLAVTRCRSTTLTARRRPSSATPMTSSAYSL